MFRFSVFLFVVVGVSLLSTGLVYLSLDEFMPYHEAALQTGWNELPANYRGLILGMLKGLGSGAFIVGLATLGMVGTLLNPGLRRFIVLLPTITIGYSILLTYATYTVYTTTPGKPPLLLTAVLVAASTVASVALWLSQREGRNGSH